MRSLLGTVALLLAAAFLAPSLAVLAQGAIPWLITLLVFAWIVDLAWPSGRHRRR